MKFVRGLASAKSVSVPVTLHGIEGRYATALFTASVKQNKLDIVEKELIKISNFLQENPKMEEFLNTPADRKLKITKVKEMLAGKYSKIIENFFDVVAENGRLDQTSKIINSFNTLMTAQRGQVNVTVTSAQALDGKTLQKLESVLGKSSLIGKNSSILLKSKVDPNLMGGLVIEVGEKTIDLSVSSKITKLNSLLATSV
jgi:F-type H+-transporting ATPase subunit O